MNNYLQKNEIGIKAVEMKCKDLMIGDWFLTSDGVPCRVDQNFGNHVWGYGQDLSISTDEPYAIPITVKILGKNGWKGHVFTYRLTRNEGDTHIEWNQDEGTLSIWVNYNLDEKGTNPDLKASIKYVHELQDALRLAGLKELADSFEL